MAHTYVQNLVHVVFSRKERRKLIPRESQPRLWGYMAGVCKREQIFVHEIGGMDDHAHMLIQLPATLSLSDAVLEIKTSSSRWMGKNFWWQRGFGAFSVSASNADAVIRYIRTQEAHHKMSFDEEFIALLKKYGRGIRFPVRIWLGCCVAPTALYHFFLPFPTALAWANLRSRLRRSVRRDPHFHPVSRASRFRGTAPRLADVPDGPI